VGIVKKPPFVGGLLIASVALWGIWAGGQVFGSLMTVPLFTDSAVAMQTYFQLPRHASVNFYLVFGPPVVGLGLAGPLLAWRSAPRARRWLVCWAACALAVSLLLYFSVETINTLIDRGMAGTHAAEEISAGLARWKVYKHGRLIFEIFGFFAAIMALRTWPND
jgi:hypothetical protein